MVKTAVWTANPNADAENAGALRVKIASYTVLSIASLSAAEIENIR